MVSVGRRRVKRKSEHECFLRPDVFDSNLWRSVIVDLTLSRVTDLSKQASMIRTSAQSLMATTILIQRRRPGGGLVIQRRSSRLDCALGFFGEGAFVNNPDWPQWMYQDEYVFDNEGSQQSDSTAFVDLLQKMPGVSVERP